MRPDGMTPPEMPDNMQAPEFPDSEMPQRPEGFEPPEGFERPEMPEGNIPEKPFGERPDMPNENINASQELSPDFIIKDGANMFGGITPLT